jgi:peptidoglycan/LPS O-acetylase OafA/YrhL
MAPSATARPSAPRRLAGLDGLRAVAALGVLVLHVTMFTQPSRPPWTVGDTVVRGLHLGVALFFVLSGFLLFGPWVRAALGAGDAPALGRYALRRVARIVPAYWLALAGAAVMLASVAPAREPSLAQLPIVLIIQQDLLPATAGKLVPPAWTLGVEVCFYAVLPLLGWLALRLRRGLPGVLALCLGLVAVSVAFNFAVELLDPLPGQLHRALPGRLYAFAAGMAAGAVAARWRPRRAVAAALVVLGGALVALNAVMWVPLRVPALAGLQDSIAAVGFAALVLAVAAGPQRLLGSAPLRRLGERSYGLYLWHFPIISALAARGWLPHTTLAGVAMVLPLGLLAAEVSWRLVERPAIGWARRHTRRSRLPRGTRAHRLGTSGALGSAPPP